MNSILIIEDDLDIQELLKEYLTNSGYVVTTAEDGVEGISAYQRGSFDLILLDLMLPKIDGYGVCELIRKESDIPIVMLTALDREEEQLKGFDLNIDDYITKPFSMSILLKKIAAILRRTLSATPGSRQVYRDLIADHEAYKVQIKGKYVELTQKEFEVLWELLSNQDRILTRQMLLNRLWKYDFYGDERVVDTHIKNLRKKLSVDYIKTLRGVGYSIDKADKK